MLPTLTLLSQPTYLGKLLLVALAYFVSGKLGLSIPYVGSNITLFWLPTGIAVAALFRLGTNLWPAVFVAAFAVNLSIGTPWLLALGIAVTNTLAPTATTWWLQYYGLHPALERRRDIVLLTTAAAVGMLISAVGGSLTLNLAGLISNESFFAAVLAWWSGDWVGVLLGGTLLLSINRESLQQIQRHALEFLVWLVVTAFVGWAVFFDNAGSDVRPLAFFTLPIVIWAAIRFGASGGAISTVVISLIAAWSTSHGKGQFYPNSLFLLWAYMGILALSALMITALLAERKRAEDRATLILQSVNQGVWGLDANGNVMFVNAAAERMFGYAQDELIGKPMHVTVHHSYRDGEHYPLAACPMHATLADGKPRMRKDEVMWRKDGSSFPVEYSSYPICSQGSLLGVVVVCQDNTEKKATEDALLSSEQRFKTIVQSNPIPILITRMADGCIIEANAAFLKMFGYTRDKLIGHTSLELNLWCDLEERARLLEELQRVGALTNAVLEYRKQSGATGMVSLSAQRITLDGEPCILGVGEDITARKLAEDRLRETNEKLRGLFDLSPVGIALTDMQGHYIEFNEAFRNICGYPEDELRQLDYWKLTPKEYADQEALQLDSLEQCGRYGPYEKEYVRKDGSRIPLQLNGMLIEGHEGQRYIWSIVEDISERKRTELQMQENQARLTGLIESAMDAIISMGEDQKVTIFNQGAERIFGYRARDILGQSIEKLFPVRFRGMHRQHVERFDSSGKATRNLDMSSMSSGLRANGEEFPFEASISKIEVAGKKYYTAILRDVTHRKQSEDALMLASSVYQASHEGIVVTDENNHIIEVNPAFTCITGYTLEEVHGRNPSMLKSGEHDKKFYAEMWDVLRQKGHWQGEVWDRRKDGTLQAKWLNISVLHHEDGSIYRHVGQFSDITEKKRKDELIWAQANYDALTNLPNRRLLIDRIHQAASSSSRSGKYGALLALDLDQFKQLNDTLGHSMGDRLLLEVARRLQASVREEDTVARLGGDEFLVVLTELSSDRSEAAIQAEQVAEKIRAELCSPYHFGDFEYHSSSSIGIILFLGHSDSHEELLAHVDSAMYQAKSNGRNTTCFFDSSMQDALEKRSQLDNALRAALVRDELILYYQLQVDHSGQPIGAEALLRWAHPKLGMVSPAQFIPVAEETGMILPIGRWVIETACAQLARWQLDPRLSHLSIAVNVSARQFRELGFVSQVREAIATSGIDPAVLKLELTESLVLHNVEHSIEKMHELRSLGIRFSMDDFGTGYSSLSYLSRLPIDQLKIDQSFVRNITTDQHDAAIVQTIISMAQGLGLEVIAEGVETEAQREFLELRGCHNYQGYLYARPMPIHDVEALLESQVIALAHPQRLAQSANQRSKLCHL